MTAQAAEPTLRLLAFRPIAKSGLAGFATIEFPIGLRLLDVPVFSAGVHGPWAGLPRKPQLDRDRRQRVDGAGKPAFEPVAEWRDRDAADRFSAAVVELVRRAHPAAFENRAA